MTVTSWPAAVNTDFFNYTETYKDNATLTSFLSGRTVGVKNNERDIKTINCYIELDKESTEYNTFWSWYNTTLGGTVGAFSCSALGSAYYRFTSVPEPQGTEQTKVTLALNIEEVY